MISITVYKNGESLGPGAYDLERVSIGSAETADLRIAEADIAPSHVEFWLEDRKCFTRLLSFTMAWVNGEELEDEVEVKPADSIRLSSEIELMVTYEIPKKSTLEEKKSTEITFKTYSDISDHEEEAPLAAVSSVPQTAKIPRPKASKKDEDRPKLRVSLKVVLTVVVIPLLFGLVFWWRVWPVIKKMNGWD